MQANKKERVALIGLSLVSFAAVATVVVGTLTFERDECIQASLKPNLLGDGLIVDNSFVPDTGGSPVYECGTGEAASRQIISDHSRITFEHILFAAPDLWGMDTEAYGGNNKIGASSDQKSSLSFWGTTNITQISNEKGAHFDTDIYQFTGGFDKVIGDWFLGSALSYAHTEDEQRTVTFTSDTVGITPYVAYKLHDNIFASALAGYLYTHTNSVNGGLDLDTHDYISEGNINAFKTINSFILKARVGVRFKHTISSPERAVPGRDNSFDELTWVGDGEIGYQFQNKLRIYTGLLYEYYDREASGASSRVRDSIAFMRYGAEYPVSRDLTLGARIQNDINEEDSDYISGSINVRLAF